VIDKETKDIIDRYDWNYTPSVQAPLDLLLPKTVGQAMAMNLKTMKSKDLRNELEDKEPITIFRSGIILTPQESKSWGLRVKKTKSVKHRNALLRLAHGEYYTAERKFRYGLIESPLCECGKIDTGLHRFLECVRTKEIWDSIRIGVLEPGNELKTYIGAVNGTSQEDIMILGEAISLVISGNYNIQIWHRYHERLKNKLNLLESRANEELVPEGHGQEVVLEGPQPETAPDQAGDAI